MLALTSLGEHLGLAPADAIDTAATATAIQPVAEAAPKPSSAAAYADLEDEIPVLPHLLQRASVRAEPLPERLVYGEALLRTYSIRRGDTLMGLLTQAHVDQPQAYAAIDALRNEFNPRHLRAGQEINLRFQDSAGNRELVGMTIDLSVSDSVTVNLNDQGTYIASRIERPVRTKMVAASGTIESSLFESGARAGVPMAVLSEMLRTYAWDIDFQRDIRRGDRFEILFDTAVSEEGEVVRHGVIHYANMMVRGEARPLYRFVDRQGHAGYYRPDGSSIRKALLRTPVDGARMSSGYGMRRHPILGYSKMHKGVDFAAPTGTPIYAAGDGVVDRIGRWGAYGKYIRIRHNDEFSTAYAHLSRYAKGLRKGDRVSQRQLIGYVGSTGRSTGPHLHYEVIRNGRQVNPNSLNLPVERNLSGRDLRDFLQMVAEREESWAMLTDDKNAGETQLAANTAALPDDRF